LCARGRAAAFGRIELRHARGERPGTRAMLRGVALDVRIALRGALALGTVEARGLAEQRHERGRLEVARPPGLHLRVRACCSTSGSQPTSSSAPVATTRSATPRARR
jgi:hypothetical protein